MIDGKYTIENVTETVLVEATFAAKAEFTIKITGEGLEKGKTGYLVNKSSKRFTRATRLTSSRPRPTAKV